MEEKAYKTMESVGIFAIVSGIIMILAGIGAGVVYIIQGARLVKDKSGLTF